MAYLFGGSKEVKLTARWKRYRFLVLWVGLIGVGVFGWNVWPTPWRYGMEPLPTEVADLHTAVPYRLNVITGEKDRYIGGNWVDVKSRSWG